MGTIGWNGEYRTTNSPTKDELVHKKVDRQTYTGRQNERTDRERKDGPTSTSANEPMSLWMDT
jgi:hypothetical protein